MKQYDEGLFGDYRGLTFIWDYAGFIQAAAFRGNEQQQHCSMAVLLFHGFLPGYHADKKDPVSGNPQTNRRYDSGRNIRNWYDGHSGDSRL